MTSKRTPTRGFTIIETLVAISILLIAITGPNLLANRSLQAALVAKDQLAAYAYAQDGMEFIRHARDTNRLSGVDWLEGSAVNLTNCVVTATALYGCNVDSFSDATPLLCIDAAGTGCSSTQYTVNAAGALTSGASNFTRVITITAPDGTAIANASVVKEVRATVKVSWTLYNIKHSVTVRENIFRW